MQDVRLFSALDEQMFQSAATGGELVAWEMLYKRFNAPLTGYAYRILRAGRCYDPPDHVKDVGQEMWCRVVRGIHQCKESPVGWLYKITSNVSKDHLQKCGRLIDSSEAWPQSPGAEERLFASQARLHSHEELYLRRLALRQALAGLSKTEAMVLVLRCDGFHYDEIAFLTRTSALNCRKIFQRVKQQLMARATEES